MADTNKQLLPHRGGSSKMTTGAGRSIVLRSGELFVEYPDTGAGTGKCKIKIGDGSTAYSALPYAVGETSTDPITFSQSTVSTFAGLLAEIADKAKLQTFIGALKQGISLCNDTFIEMNKEDWFATGKDHGVMTKADKTKLNGIAAGAEVNQNAFSTIRVTQGSVTTSLVADTKTDGVDIVAGPNVVLTPDAAGTKMTI